MNITIDDECHISHLSNGFLQARLAAQKGRDLKKALNRSLNTWPEAPPWLFKLCDELDKLYPDA